MKTIFCLPYAGGAASAYGDIKKYAQSRNLELVPIEYAGRASRIGDASYKNIYDAANDCYTQIKEYFSTHFVQEYGIFGHSMGSWIVYEIMRILQEKEEVRKPEVLFLSANTIPQIKIEKRMSQMDDDTFWKEMYQLGGLEKELYEVIEFKDYILPIIKNDYRILEDYAGPEVGKIMIDADICVMGGHKDTITEEEYRQWNLFTDKSFDIQWFQGNHFYFREEGKNLVDYFCQKMQSEI